MRELWLIVEGSGASQIDFGGHVDKLLSLYFVYIPISLSLCSMADLLCGVCCDRLPGNSCLHWVQILP